MPLLATSLRGYKPALLPSDAVAAATLLVIVIPEQLATARLAGMPPVTGLYAFVAGSVLFALLGSNPQLSVGADSTIAPLIAVGMGHLAPASSPQYIALVGMLAVTVGVVVALVGILRLGWIGQLLSAPIITGFLAGVSIIIVVHQLPDLFGIEGSGGSTLHRLSGIVHHLHSTNWRTFAIGAGVFAVVAAAERIDKRLPGALVGLVGSTALVAGLHLRDHGVAVLGTVAPGAPHFGLSPLSWSSLGSVFPIAAVVALVVVTQSAATTRAFADQGGYEVDLGRDFIGVGAGSIVAGLSGAFAVNASPPRTAAIASAGGKTQAAPVMTAAAVIAVIPAMGLLKDLPLATLAAVLIGVAIRIFHVRDMRAVLRFDYFEFALAIVTLLAVALVGVEQGIAVAVGLAILDRARLAARPSVHRMGRIPGTTSWEPEKAEAGGSKRSDLEQEPGVLVLLFASPVYFANAGHFRTQFQAFLKAAGPGVRAVVIDAVGMNDIDFTGAHYVANMLDQMDKAGIAVAFARAGEHLKSNLDRAGLGKRIGADHFFDSTDAAAAAMGSPGAGVSGPAS